MKYLFLSITLLVCCLIANAQLKTYSGPFKVAVNRANGDDRTGKATYTYREIDDERVKEGKFSFTTDEMMQPITITGEFKNGEKNGHWKIVTQGRANTYQNMMYSLDTNCSAINVLITNGVKTIMEGNYIDGLRTGKWSFSKTDLKTGTSYKSEATFKNGKFYGSFVGTYHVTKISGDILYKDISVTGKFVEGGLPDSVWKAKWKTADGIEYLTKLTFNKGKAVSFKVTDLSTGEDLSKDINNTGNDFLEHNPRNMNVGKGIRSDSRAVYFPMPFQMMLTGWSVDESLLTIDRDDMKILFLDWN